MQQFHPRSVTLQVTDFLRKELHQGNWEGEIPGISTLSTKLGVNHKTVETALKQLEQDGLLEKQGPGKPRRIIRLDRSKLTSSLRIGILLLDQTTHKAHHISKIRQTLENEGYHIVFSPKTVTALKHDPHRIANMVKQCSVDCWIIPGASQEVLTWFSRQDLPAFALAGRFKDLPIPGIFPEKSPALSEAIHQLVQNNHRRIVLLTRRARRIPEPGHFESLFLKELKKYDITSSLYNLPNWEENAEGLHAGLESLFQLTPPTAIISDEATFIGGILQFCARKGLAVPRDLSLISADPDPSFDWFHPALSHIYWNSEPIAQRIIHWATNVRNGIEDLRQSCSPATFSAGATIGPAAGK